MRLIAGAGLTSNGRTLALSKRGARVAAASSATAGGTGYEQAEAAVSGMYFRAFPNGLTSVGIGAMRVHYSLPGTSGTPVTFQVTGQTLSGLTPGASYWLYVVADQTQDPAPITAGYTAVVSGLVDIPDEFNQYNFFAQMPLVYPPPDATIITQVDPLIQEFLILKYTSPQTSGSTYAYYLIAEVDVDDEGRVTVRQRHLGALHVIGAPMVWYPEHVLTASEAD